MRRVVAEAPASTANLGPGFDVFGLCLSEPRDVVVIEEHESLTIESDAPIPKEPERNCAGMVALSMMKDFDLPAVKIVVKKGVPIGLGLGSSAASSVATAFAMNELFDLGLSGIELVRYAVKGELASAGVEHADNVSASALGGFVIVMRARPIEAISVKAPDNLGLCVAIPEVETDERKTEKFRSVIPRMVRLEDMIHNMGNATSIVYAMLTGRLDLLKGAVDDAIVEPARAPLIPGYHEVKREALKAGALAVAVSGAGPAMIAFYDSEDADKEGIGEAMKAGFMKAGVRSRILHTSVGEGARILVG